MNKKFTRLLTFFLIILVGFLNAKDLNIDSLEKDIIKYNREGKQKSSQKILSDLLFSGDLSTEEEANVLFFMATTYRSVSDYMMCIDYLNKSSSIAKDLPKDHILKMKLDYEYAFAYFDNKEYQRSSEIMRHIASQHYKNVIPEDQSYILMQEGYLLLKKRELDTAEKKYKEALDIMKKANYCNLPIVYVKMMELYSQKKDIVKVEDLYKETMEISKGCNILKYETYATSEMEKIYKQNNLLDKAYTLGQKVDSLRKIENLDFRVSEMHVLDKKYLEERELLQDKSATMEKIGAIFVALLLLSFIGYSFFRGKNLRDENLKMEEEIEQMKVDLESYSQTVHHDEKFVDPQSTFSNFDKLTDRQKDLVKLLAEGFSNKEIAEKLFITESTVKYHIKNIYSILDLRDRKDLFKKMSNH